jgi:hypothetical protein
MHAFIHSTGACSCHLHIGVLLRGCRAIEALDHMAGLEELWMGHNRVSELQVCWRCG